MGPLGKALVLTWGGSVVCDDEKRASSLRRALMNFIRSRDDKELGMIASSRALLAVSASRDCIAYEFKEVERVMSDDSESRKWIAAVLECMSRPSSSEIHAQNDTTGIGFASHKTAALLDEEMTRGRLSRVADFLVPTVEVYLYTEDDYERGHPEVPALYSSSMVRSATLKPVTASGTVSLKDYVEEAVTMPLKRPKLQKRGIGSARAAQGPSTPSPAASQKYSRSPALSSRVLGLQPSFGILNVNEANAEPHAHQKKGLGGSLRPNPSLRLGSRLRAAGTAMRKRSLVLMEGDETNAMEYKRAFESQDKKREKAERRAKRLKQELPPRPAPVCIELDEEENKTGTVQEIVEIDVDRSPSIPAKRATQQPAKHRGVSGDDGGESTEEDNDRPGLLVEPSDRMEVDSGKQGEAGYQSVAGGAAQAETSRPVVPPTKKDEPQLHQLQEQRDRSQEEQDAGANGTQNEKHEEQNKPREPSKPEESRVEMEIGAGTDEGEKAQTDFNTEIHALVESADFVWPSDMQSPPGRTAQSEVEGSGTKQAREAKSETVCEPPAVTSGLKEEPNAAPNSSNVIENDAVEPQQAHRVVVPKAEDQPERPHETGTGDNEAQAKVEVLVDPASKSSPRLVPASAAITSDEGAVNEAKHVDTNEPVERTSSSESPSGHVRLGGAEAGESSSHEIREEEIAAFRSQPSDLRTFLKLTEAELSTISDESIVKLLKHDRNDTAVFEGNNTIELVIGKTTERDSDGKTWAVTTLIRLHNPSGPAGKSKVRVRKKRPVSAV